MNNVEIQKLQHGEETLTQLIIFKRAINSI
jgi:hypothetical protein